MTRLFEAKPFIIAEVGSNHLGAQEAGLRQCLESIGAAKAVGADAVKFQMFTSEALYGTGYGALTHELPAEWLPRLAEAAKNVDIELMVTAFSPELVAVVDPYVSVHKVASSDLCYPQLLEAVALTGKPVLLSMGGGKTAKDLKAAVGAAIAGKADRISYLPMYCVASYPTDFVDMDAIYDLEEDVNEDNEGHIHIGVGFSDHTLGYTATVEAARRGALVIEKHFTAFPDLDTPDRPHSLNPKQFKRMVDIIRGREVESEERAMFLRANRRLIATTDLSQGETLKYGVNFGSFRSLVDDTRGLSPFEWERVNGRRTSVAKTRGSSIGEGDFE